jgi:hypothetical protein
VRPVIRILDVVHHRFVAAPRPCGCLIATVIYLITTAATVIT